MIRKWLKPSLLILGLSIGINTTYAQEKEGKVISVDELFSLVKENHPSLKVYQSDIEIAKQNVEVAKNQMLPEISVGLQGYYLGDAHVIDKDFSNATRVDMPNFGNKFSVEARQLIWKGGAVRNAIAIQDLRKDLAKLNYDGNELNFNFCFGTSLWSI